MPHHLRRSEAIWRCRQERTVKPSAQPTLVRTQHLPHVAKTARWLRKRGLAGHFLLVTMCIKGRPVFMTMPDGADFYMKGCPSSARGDVTGTRRGRGLDGSR